MSTSEGYFGIFTLPCRLLHLDAEHDQRHGAAFPIEGGWCDDVVMELIDAADNVWKGDHELTADGVINAQACATSRDGHSSCTSVNLSTYWVEAGGGAFVTSPDNIFSVRVPDGSITQDGYMLVMPSGAALRDEQSLDRVSTRPAPAGVYFDRLETVEATATRKLMLVR